MTQVQSALRTPKGGKGDGSAGKQTILIAGGGPIQRGILMPHDKHRNLGPILALVPDLFGNEIVGLKTLDFGGPQQPPLLFFLEAIVESILVDERRVGEAGEDGEEPRMLSLSPDGGLSEEIRSESSDPFPILEVVDVDLVFDLLSDGIDTGAPALCFLRREKRTHVFLVHDDEVILYQRPDDEFRILLFGDEILVRETWIGDIDRDDFLSRSVLVRDQVKECTVVSDAFGYKGKVSIQKRGNSGNEGDKHVVTGVEFVDELDPFQIWADLVLFEVCDPKKVFLRVGAI